LAEESENGRTGAEKPAGLTGRPLKLMREMSIERCEGNGSKRKSSRHYKIMKLEKWLRLAGCNCIGRLGLNGAAYQ
jgi:hypothetical protein